MNITCLFPVNYLLLMKHGTYSTLLGFKAQHDSQLLHKEKLEFTEYLTCG